MTVADPGGDQSPGPPPTPVKTSQKKDGCHMGPQVSLVIGPPPLGQISGYATGSYGSVFNLYTLYWTQTSAISHTHWLLGKVFRPGLKHLPLSPASMHGF